MGVPSDRNKIKNIRMKNRILTILKQGCKPAIIVLLLSALIFLPDIVYFSKNGVYNYLLIGMAVVPMLLLIPTALFSANLRIYYVLLGIIVMFSPVALLPVLLINSQPNSEMIGLMLDTNYYEVKELLGWRIFLILLMMVAFFIVFIWLSSKLPRKIKFSLGFTISAIAMGLFLLLPFTRTTLLSYHKQIMKNTLKAYYPFRIGDAISYLSRELKNVENYNKNVADFKFEIINKDTASSRKIQILIIGEAARYDHWSVNGYHRQTSPNLDSNSNLVTFSNVATGGTMTNVSVPLIITRADASDFDLHKRERSILSAYKEAGWRSFWVSNQSKYGLTGNIGMHYNDGDTAIFNGWGANETNFQGSTDSALVPMVKEILAREKGKNIFMVVHTIGSHWRYLLRYPHEFTKFTPVSDRNRMVMGYPPREIMINEYDNSIFYTDYIIQQLINAVKAEGAISSLLYVADHGENLGDDERKLYFHSYNPSSYTAHVPLFIWTSDSYNQRFPNKIEQLRNNSNRPVSSAGNVFQTLLDLSALGFSKEDSTKSLASPYFKDNEQKVLGENGKVLLFRDIK